MLINIKKIITILSTLILGVMCSFCSEYGRLYNSGGRSKLREVTF